METFIKTYHIVRIYVVLLLSSIAIFTSCGENENKHIVDDLNEKSYDYHYRDLDSTFYYAERAFKEANNYDDGKAEALNNLAFVSIAKMDYDKAYKLLEEASKTTDNQVEQLISDVQYMRLCQRQSKNKDFYDYQERAKVSMKRIDEERKNLDEHQQRRYIYAYSEFYIVTSTYYYYVGLEEPSVDAINKIDPNGEILTDTAQTLNYFYNIGSGGIITEGTKTEIAQNEFDYLMRCYLLAIKCDYPYWEANSIQAMSEHLKDPTLREFIITENMPAMKYINIDNMPDSLLAGNLAQRSLNIFLKYGDVYQTSGAYRTLAECYWEVKDYSSSILCLYDALNRDKAIQKAPDLVASIREQLSLAYSAIDDKPHSDYNRNVYLDMQEKTRQDRQLEARAAQLDKSSQQLNWMIFAVIIMILITIVLLFLFDYMRRKSERKFSVDTLLMPLNRWKLQNEKQLEESSEKYEEINEQRNIVKQNVLKNKKQNVENRAKISLVTSIIPFIDRIINEVKRLSSSDESDEVKQERYTYIIELTEKINEYNDVLTKWIQMRRGDLILHIESFQLQPLFDIIKKGRMGFQLKGVTLNVVNTTDIVKADKTLTMFMLNTLADNARKFTQTGGSVTISSKSFDDYIELSVTDTGCGLSEEEITHIFDHKPIKDDNIDNTLFTKEHSHGFGLMNCKGIIDKYKKISTIFSVCSISVDSKKGNGSRFYFRLPKGTIRIIALIIMSVFSFISPSIHVFANNTSRDKSKMMFKTDEHDLLGMANVYADSAYFSNINGTYNKTLVFADSCRYYLNKYYLQTIPNGKNLMVAESKNSDLPSEIKWYHDSLQTNYNIVLDIRNESAVAALALHKWSLYSYNNSVYTKLFRERSADNTLGEYVRAMQKSKINKNVSIIFLLLMFVLIFPAYYILYYRHRLSYRLCVYRVKGINDVLLSNKSAESKIRKIDEIWADKHSDMIPKFTEFNSVVVQIKRALHRSIETKNARSEDIEMAEDELRRTVYENDKLHISNNVLDNCLSTLKHETMYYPSRIRQMINDNNSDLSSIYELVSYYKDLYLILISQLQRQTEYSICIGEDMIKYLFEILQKLSGSKTICHKVTDIDYKYVEILIPMSKLIITDEQMVDLFTPNTIDIQYLICRQIVREIGDFTNSYGCGIQALRDTEGIVNVKIILTKSIWTNLKL